MADGTARDRAAGDGSTGDVAAGEVATGEVATGPADGQRSVDLRWARRQRLLSATGALISLLALLGAIGGMSTLPLSAADARPYAITAVVGTAVLTAACIVIVICWLLQLPRWAVEPAAPAADAGGYPGRSRVSLVAHIASYPAVLVTMYGALAASALAYWDSLAGSLFGITFILAIFGQILGGTQLLRRSGPTATIPAYLRKLNDKVQSLR